MTAWIQRLLDQATHRAGVITVFLTLAGFGLGGLLLGPQQAIWVALSAFGVGGALESLHRQTQAKVVELSMAERQDARDTFFWQLGKSQPGWKPKMFKQFQHGGLLWNTIGFEQVPFPMTVTGPLCPRCQRHLAERFENLFPGRLRITARCSEDCGFEQRLKQPADALRQEAHSMAGTPV